MDWNESTRRTFLKQFGAAGALALTAANADGMGLPGNQAAALLPWAIHPPIKSRGPRASSA